jgi:signal recognition particle receptor subunit beta
MLVAVLMQAEDIRNQNPNTGEVGLMVVFNYSGREINAKVVYYGPGLSGKTTNLEHVYAKTAGHLRGKMVSMKTKVDRTLFFDFLPIEGGEIAGFNIRFLLYTVPGQVYYNATRKLVLKGADAIVFVADSQAEEMAANRESLKNLRENLDEHGKDLDDIPLVIQYNKRDLPSALSIEKLNEELNPKGVTSFESVATTGTGVFETLAAATKMVLSDLRTQLVKDQAEEVDSGGREISFGFVPEPAGTRATGEQAEKDSSTIKDKVPDVPSPGEEPAPVPTDTDAPCPPDQHTETEQTVQATTAPTATAVSETPEAGTGQSVEITHSARIAAGKGGKLSIPVRVGGNGKPGHVILNLAVDIEILTEEDDKTV